ALAAVGLASGAHLRRYVRAQLDEREIITAVDRQLDDALLIDDRAKRAIGGLEHLRARLDLDDFSHRADLQRNVDALDVADLYLTTVDAGRLEALELGGDVVNPGIEERNRIVAGLIGLHRTRNSRRRIGDSDF